MKKNILHFPVLLSINILLLGILACNVSAAVLSPTATVMPSPVPATGTSSPLLSQQVTVVSQPLGETNPNPPFTLTAQTPQLTGSDDPRVTTFNQRLNELVKKEVDAWRENFLQITTVFNGSTLDATYKLVSQIGDLWSFKFDFHFYSDGAAHPGLYSITLNYDLGQGRELALGDLFLPNSNYLEVIANSCITELSKQPGFEGPFADGAKPTPENYRNWNITPDGLLITFDTYQVAPGASGPMQVLVPYDQLKEVIDPQGPLAGVVP
ncbi:MAG: RsiV family protein [Syntrophothermus sp.]